MDINNLKKLLPNVDLTTNQENHKIMTDPNLHNEQKFIKILLNHFNSQKTKYVDNQALKTEAKYINKLFPKLARSYILDQLSLFEDMPQRVEIVLRTIVDTKYKIYKVDTKKPTTVTIKRTTPTITPTQINNYCHPIKIKKIKYESGPIYAVENSIKTPTIPTNYHLVPPISSHSFNANNTPYFVANSEIRTFPNTKHQTGVKSCTVTSVTASPETQNNILDESNKLLVVDYSNLQECSSNVFTRNTYQNCDSSSHIREPTPPSMNSAIVSSSDEILFCIKPTEENVPTSSEQFNNLDSVIIQPNCLNEPQTSNTQQEADRKLLDESALPVAQNCIINSSNEGVDVVNKTTYLEHINGMLRTITNEALEERSAENIAHPSLKTEEQPEEDFEDSDKTILLPSEAYSDLNMKNIVDDNEDSNKPDVFIDDFKEENDVQYVYEMPSTSKQNDKDVSEEFNLVDYLHEVTSAPINVIFRHCKKLRIRNYTKKPSIHFLDKIVDKLLTNDISSENSDYDDDSDDPDAVKIISEENPRFTTSAPQKRVKSVIKDTSMVQNNITFSCNQESNQDDVKNLSSETANITSTEGSVNMQLVNYLCGIFPDACPIYIKGLCKNKSMNNEVVDCLTTVILNSNGEYPKRPSVQPEPDVFPENQFEILTEFLPDADPDYLRMMCDRFEGKPELVKTFLNEAMENRNYPTMKEYQRRQQLSAQQKQYTTEFNVENFIKVIPDPHNFFSDSSRVVTMDPLSSHYALVFLRNTFSKLPIRMIQSTFTKSNCNLSKTYKELQNAMCKSQLLMKSTRKAIEMPNGMQNIPLLQEIAYFSHQTEINKYLQKIKEKEEAERQEAISKGLIKTCNCCYDEEVLPRDIFTCENGCSFCKCCILKSTEVRFGEGKLDFPCLMNCASQFSLQTLQAVLSPKLFSKIAQKKALEEVKAAGIEELEMCPFCDFATIPAAGYTIFSCLNPECMKESCRLCKEPSHIPLRCEEIEKDEDVQARTFVENKMTEALLKKCWKCGIKFFKEEGCNKMTCSCGASMCYVCGEPVTDYKHFNGNGGDRFDLCPLYSDTNILNKENVLKAAEQAKAEIGNRELKHDPTTDVDKHYKERASKFPEQQLLVQQQRQAEVFFFRMRDALDQHRHRHRRRHHHHHH